MNNELVKSYSKVDKLFKENVKLQEEKKVLQGIHRVNTDLHDKMKEAERKTEEKESQSETDDETDEEIEVVEFFMKQRENRSNRTNPASNAEKPRNNSTGSLPKNQRFTCSKCNFVAVKEDLLTEHSKIHRFGCEKCIETFMTKGLLNRHIKDKHIPNEPVRPNETESPQDEQTSEDRFQREPEPFRCEKCDFKGKSKLQMEKHWKVAHGFKAVCLFWRNGDCYKGSECPYSHPVSAPICRDGEFCLFWPQCRYSHPEICRYQKACRNHFCPFIHVNNEDIAFLGNGRRNQNPPQNQGRPAWRPWQ